MRAENHKERMLDETTGLSYVEVNGVPEVALVDYERKRLSGHITILAQGEEAPRLYETLGLEEARRLAGQLRSGPEQATYFSPAEIESLRAEVNETAKSLFNDGWNGYGWETPRLDAFLNQKDGAYLTPQEAREILKELGENDNRLRLEGWNGWGGEMPGLTSALQRASREHAAERDVDF